MTFAKAKNFYGPGGFSLPLFCAAIFFFLIFALCPINLQGDTGQPEKTAAAAEADKADAKKKDTPVEEGEVPPIQQDYTLDDFGARAEEESYGWTIFKLLFILGMMGAGFYYFFRFVSRQTGVKLLGRDVVSVLSVVPLGPNKYLQVIDLDGRVLVLGVTDSNINLITEVTSKSEIDRMRLLSSRSPDLDRPAFQEQLMGFVNGVRNRISEKRKGASDPEKFSAAGSDDIEYSEDYLLYLKSQKDRLKKMNGKKDD